MNNFRLNSFSWHKKFIISYRYRKKNNNHKRCSKKCEMLKQKLIKTESIIIIFLYEAVGLFTPLLF